MRFPHHAVVLHDRPPLPWLEVHPENYLADAAARAELREIRRDYPLSLHAVGLSLGSATGIDSDHAKRLKALVDEFEPGLVSDHLSWSATDGLHLPDLLPLPYTEETLRVVADNLHRAQSILRRPLLIENPSTYLGWTGATMTEAEFMAELVARTGCRVLLDVNNVYVSAYNLGQDPRALLGEFLTAIHSDQIGEIHLAGHSLVTFDGPEAPRIRIDDHGSPVCAEVWPLYELTIAQFGAMPTLIEWDTDIPEFDVLVVEAGRAQRILSARGAPVIDHAAVG